MKIATGCIEVDSIRIRGLKEEVKSLQREVMDAIYQLKNEKQRAEKLALALDEKPFLREMRSTPRDDQYPVLIVKEKGEDGRLIGTPNYFCSKRDDDTDGDQWVAWVPLAEISKLTVGVELPF